MLLVVDSGNTNTVFAVYEEEECRGVWRCGSNPRRTADEYAVWLIDLMALENLNRVLPVAPLSRSFVVSKLAIFSSWDVSTPKQWA